MANESQFKAMKRLEQVWRDIGILIRQCAGNNRITENDEDRYEKLITEGRYLYGRVSQLIGTAGMQGIGHKRDAFQNVLGQGSVDAVISDEFGRGVWDQLWSVGQSAIQQAVGRAEEEAKRGRLDPDPAVVRRYRHLIGILETARAGFAAPVRVTSHVVARIEESTPYRVAAIVAVIVAFGAIILGALKAFGVY